MTSSFVIHQWNCHSFHSNGPEYIWNLSNSSTYPDVICLQETWFKSETDLIEINGYTVADFSVRDGIKGGGTAIYVKVDIPYSKKEINSKFETSVIQILINSDMVTIISLYDASTDTKEDDYINLLNQIEGKFIICGDFNAHHYLWGSNKTDTKGNSLHNAISTNNIIVLNDGSGTRQNPSDLQLSCIDISMSSVQLAHQITWTVDNKSLYGSDHFVIQLTLNQTSSCSNSEHELIWNYKKADWDGFASSCHKQLSESMITDNINESCTHLTNTIIKIAGEHIPSKKRRKNNKPEVPWWNENCTLVVKERNKARNKARHTGGGHDYLLYKEKEKECRNTIKLTQQQYWETFCSGLNNNNNIGQKRLIY
ncbi:unnamed protein product [Mytilus edulis]|uniref:Endonuclease/exonuclease/phosphatase domain-containing protein n=1 Tax=Mytilus edulis TaxID=6550 RepID=A0A8S3SW63_MYTED|nr:unnamed protein product [Mytilus edulis]